jgi:hypothetical protein
VRRNKGRAVILQLKGKGGVGCGKCASRTQMPGAGRKRGRDEWPERPAIVQEVGRGSSWHGVKGVGLKACRGLLPAIALTTREEMASLPLQVLAKVLQHFHD